jgi:hypothetical protein
LGEVLPVWIRVKTSMASSRVPKPPGKTAMASASLTKATFLLKKYL